MESNIQSLPLLQRAESEVYKNNYWERQPRRKEKYSFAWSVMFVSMFDCIRKEFLFYQIGYFLHHATEDQVKGLDIERTHCPEKIVILICFLLTKSPSCVFRGQGWLFFTMLQGLVQKPASIPAAMRTLCF